jgi:hypothetical protein
MQTRDFLVANGYMHIHLSVNDTADACYIFVNDIYDEKLTMRYFTDMGSALAWIDSHCA